MAHHNKLRDGVVKLAGKSFTPPHVRNDPLIFAGCAVKRQKAKPDRSKAKATSNTPQLEATKQKGDLLFRDLWKNGTGSVHDMLVVNIDAKSHSEKTPENCLLEAERAKKKKMYLEACLQQSQQLSLFISSSDGLLGV